MFKTDPKSLEELSFDLTVKDVSRLRFLLDVMNREGVSTLSPEDFRRVYDGLASIEALKLDGQVYAFNVCDAFAANQGGDAGEGVGLYMRRGNTLREFAVNSDRDWVLKVAQVVPRLKKAGISTVYTGDIKDNFLGLAARMDPDDPIIHKRLMDYDISGFKALGIDVVVLDNFLS
jgi:hypothetical protein